MRHLSGGEGIRRGEGRAFQSISKFQRNGMENFQELNKRIEGDIVVVSRPTDRKITLYRGEYFDLRPTIKENGVRWDNRLDASELEDLPQILEEETFIAHTDPSILLVYAKSIITKHIAQQRRSPFVSFSGKLNVAKKYATYKDEKDGLLITAEIRILKELAYERTPIRPPFNFGLFVDNANRIWIYVPFFRPHFNESLEMVEAFQLANRDDEYLLLGDLYYSDDFRMRIIKMTPKKRRQCK